MTGDVIFSGGKGGGGVGDLQETGQPENVISVHVVYLCVQVIQ